MAERRMLKAIVSGMYEEKSNKGEMRDWAIVAFVDTTALGGESGTLDVVVKSFTPGVLFWVDVQPDGSRGGVRESKVCRYGKGVTWEKASKQYTKTGSRGGRSERRYGTKILRIFVILQNSISKNKRHY